MNAKEQEERQKVVDIAKSYIGTPYHHMGRQKGAGVDCGMLLLNVFEEAGLIEHVEVGNYPPDWMCHRSEQKYLGWVEKYCHKVEREPLPGDIILHQWGRCISHGGIVVDYPQIIHAFKPYRAVCYGDNEQKRLKTRMRAVYSYW